MAAYSDADKDKTNSKRLYDLQCPDREVLEYFVDHMLDCSLYQSEFKECKKWFSRIDQRYVYGQKLDCDHMNLAYKACKNMEKGDEAGREYVLAYEQAKIDFRMENAQGNDVWEYRTRVPEDWTSELKVTDDLKAIEKDKNEIKQQSNVVDNDNNNNKDNSRIVPSDFDSCLVENNSESKGENSSVTKNSPSLEQYDNSSAAKKGGCVIS